MRPAIDFTGTRFDGDGRTRIDPLPQDVLPGTQPLSVNRAQAKNTISYFMANGGSTHSGRGGVLWIVREWCRVRAVKHTIKGTPGNGFYVQRKP